VGSGGYILVSCAHSNASYIYKLTMLNIFYLQKHHESSIIMNN